jgi:hypothetical protein
VQYGIDVSSHQPADLTDIIREHKPEHVIVRVYLDHESPPLSHSAAQIASARAMGCTVGGYIWAYQSVDPAVTIDRTIRACAQIGLVLPVCWIDCETYASRSGVILDEGPDAKWLRAALARAHEYEMPCGIYTASWWVKGHFPGGYDAYREFAGLPQWLAEYDGVANLDDFEPFSGITQISAKQWSVWKGAYELDRTVIRDEFTIAAGDPPESPKDDTAALKATVEGLRVALDDVAYERLNGNIRTLEILHEAQGEALKLLKETRDEARKIRVQFLGEP